MPHSTWRTYPFNLTETWATNRLKRNPTTHPLSLSRYPKPSIADYHPTKKHSTSLRQSPQIKWIQRKPSLLQNTKKKHKRTNEKNRTRNIIWFNPPCSNVVETFLNLIKRQFPPKHDLHPVFNKNNVKVSYGCISIMGRIINSHNKKIVNVTTTTTTTPHRKTDATVTVEKDQCTLDTNCLITSVIIFQAKLTTDIDNTRKNYIGLTEGMFQQRCTQHKQTFRIRKYANYTEIWKHIWKLKDRKKNYKISWSIISPASAYNNISKRSNLYLTEKLHIIKSRQSQ